MFSPWTSQYLPFWPAMSVSMAVLLLMVFLFSSTNLKSQIYNLKSTIPNLKSRIPSLILAVALAAALWAIFWMGDKVSQWIFPSFARMQVDSIYSMKGASNEHLIAGLLLCWIGPVEELFWRGFIQRSMVSRFAGMSRGKHWWQSPAFMAYVVTTLLYALVHVASFNFMLIIAALVCGIVWGGFYYLMPHRLDAIVLSHALWDAAVFVWFPIH